MTRRVSGLLAAFCLSTTVLAGGLFLPFTSQDVAAATPAHPGIGTFVDERRSTAQRLERDGNLAGALLEWRYIAAVRPNNAEARGEIKRLTSLIGSRARGHLADADAAMARGRQQQARTLYLKVLALDGSNARAKQQLRLIERSRVLAGQNKKDEKALAEYRGQHKNEQKASPSAPSVSSKNRSAVPDAMASAFNKKAYTKAAALAQQRLAKNPKDNVAADYFRRSKIELAKQSRKAGKPKAAVAYLTEASKTHGADKAAFDKMIAEARREIAEDLYADGLSRMNTNLDGAIDSFNEALTYDPKHLGARQKLAQAQKMRERLRAFD